MPSTKICSILAVAAAALLLQACATGYPGDILGGGPTSRQMKGIVRSVETRGGECRIDLDETRTSSGYLTNPGGTYGDSGRGNPTSLYCDDTTRVYYQGQSFRPVDLERGDEITANVSYVGGRVMADRIDVTYDVSRNDRYGGTSPGADRYGSYGQTGSEDLRATVRSVDRQSRLLTLERVEYYDRTFERNGGDLLTVRYDDDTRVTYRGQSNRPDNLEPGDVIAVKLSEVRGGFVADDIQVLADARETATYPR